MAERMVVDASVAIKWFLKDSLETDSDLADSILLAMLAGDIELYAPRIIVYEVCGVLTRACLTRAPGSKQPRISKGDAGTCLRDFLSLPIQIDDLTADDLVKALEMAVDYNKTHWDMAYVQLAEKLASQWLTADDKFFKAIPVGFPTHLTLRLSDLRQP
jgi:predicted nucleic acid-binding protein